MNPAPRSTNITNTTRIGTALPATTPAAAVSTAIHLITAPSARQGCPNTLAPITAEFLQFVPSALLEDRTEPAIPAPPGHSNASAPAESI